jgi:acid phosphatase type 7
MRYRSFAFMVVAAAAGCSGSPSPSSPGAIETLVTRSASAEAPEYAGPPATLVGAGDIAICGSPGAEQTARLLDGIAGTVFTAGDNTYPSGTATSFLECYEPTWGRHKARTRPAPGNHDYDVPGAAPYYDYFGDNAGDGRGYYSYKLGAWLILSLNSNVPAQQGSQQYEWVKSELSSHGGKCALAYWHHPVITSGPNGDNPHMRAMWELMAQQKVDVVMSGHDHLFERFAPMSGDLSRAPAGGVRLFIVGTGGAKPYTSVSGRAASEIRASVWGVLKLTLRNDDYEWEFLSVPGANFHDAGSDRCH